MLLPTILLAFTSLLGGVHAAALPLEVETSVVDARDNSILEARATTLFTIGYALCGSGTTNSESIFPWPGNIDVGCHEFNSAEQDTGDTGREDFFSLTVCGVKTNFYKKNGNYDFYKDNGDGTLRGTCYPRSPANKSCLVPIGSCGIHSLYRCEYVGKGLKLCN
jgi:hypothetical protein